MATIRITQQLDASPDDVWKVVADYGNLDWFPGVDDSRAEGDARVVKFGDMEITEDIVTLDNDLRRLQYRIGESPMSFDFHLATVDVLDLDLDLDGSTLLVYSCDIEPDEGKDLMEPILQGAVDALRERFGG